MYCARLQHLWKSYDRYRVLSRWIPCEIRFDRLDKGFLSRYYTRITNPWRGQSPCCRRPLLVCVCLPPRSPALRSRRRIPFLRLVRSICNPPGTWKSRYLQKLLPSSSSIVRLSMRDSAAARNPLACTRARDKNKNIQWASAWSR